MSIEAMIRDIVREEIARAKGGVDPVDPPAPPPEEQFLSLLQPQEAKAGELYQRFLAWQSEHAPGSGTVTPNRFGRAARRLGIERRSAARGLVYVVKPRKGQPGWRSGDASPKS